MVQTLVKKDKTSSLKKEEVVKEFLPIVRKIATALARRSTDPVEDLIQVGTIGLLEAFERYEDGYDTEFKTYATHFITGHIRHYLRDKQNLFKGPRALQELSCRLHQITNNLTQKFGRKPTNLEIADALEVTVERIDEIKIYDRRVTVLWLDQELLNSDDEENCSLWDFVSNAKSKHPNDEIENRLVLLDAIEKLPLMQKDLLKLRYFQDKTQSEISQYLGISQMEVCRKLKKAEKQLKRILNI